jgi:putative transposase
MKFLAIDQQRREFGVAWMCRRLDVSRSGYYAWAKREPSRRSRDDQRLKVKVAAAFQENRRVYGSPRLVDELRDAGERVSRKRVARLMKEQGLCARIPRRFRKTTDSSHGRPASPDLVRRDFRPSRPDELWAADITYIRTWEGWLYLAVVVDLFSRRVVGWAAATHLGTDLALDALLMAVRNRRPPRGMVHHSDRGVQYSSRRYRKFLKRHGIKSSMSRKGDCWDNAVVESFFGTLKSEVIYRCVLPTRTHARWAIIDFIENFYNPKRRHSTLGNISPIRYEQKFIEQHMAA